MSRTCIAGEGRLCCRLAGRVKVETLCRSSRGKGCGSDSAMISLHTYVVASLCEMGVICHEVVSQIRNPYLAVLRTPLRSTSPLCGDVLHPHTHFFGPLCVGGYRLLQRLHLLTVPWPSMSAAMYGRGSLAADSCEQLVQEAHHLSHTRFFASPHEGVLLCYNLEMLSSPSPGTATSSPAYTPTLHLSV